MVGSFVVASARAIDVVVGVFVVGYVVGVVVLFSKFDVLKFECIVGCVRVCKMIDDDECLMFFFV